jgi:uncharacterized protein involved in response to NO
VSALFAYGFRPFFLCAAGFGIVAVAIWVSVLHGYGPTTLPVNVTHWHAHEMLVGFAMAAVAGFLLTAIATWTGRPPVRGVELAGLMAVWLAGRLALGFDSVLGAGWVAIIDSVFPAMLLLLVAREILTAENAHNMPIIWLCGLLLMCNSVFHASRMGWFGLAMGGERTALYLLMHMLLIVITVISGRIIPNFTVNWLRARDAEQVPDFAAGLDRMTIAVTALAGVSLSVLPYARATGGIALLAAALHLLRLLRWQGWRTGSEPLLLILHLAYLWLPIGYVLSAAGVYRWVEVPAAGVHAFAVGAISLMILAVATRVALAHTGRPLQAARLTVFAYILLVCAAFARVGNPGGAQYFIWLEVAAVAWIASFALFLWVYAPILMAPRMAESVD